MIRHTACTSLFVAVLALTAPSLALAAVEPRTQQHQERSG